MPVSAVVITLHQNPRMQQSALSALRGHPQLTLGELERNQLPAVIETDTIAQGVDMVREQLHAIEGVEFVHVISVDFSDIDDFDEKLPPKRRRSRS